MSDKIKVNKGDPTENGMYVAYALPVDSSMEKILLMFIDGKWGYARSDQWYIRSNQFYKGKIIGWIGPLPSNVH